MSQRYSIAPFGRGQTFGTTDANVGKHWEGYEKWFPDWLWSDVGPVKTKRSDRYVLCRIVRNSSGVSLPPKRLVFLTSHNDSQGALLGGTAGGRASAKVGGISRIPDTKSVLVDEFLPSAGVASNDLFWVVVKGPGLGITALTTMTAIDVGDFITNLTAATSAVTNGITSGGRLNQHNGASTQTPDQILNIVGRALSAATSQQYGADILVDVGNWS